MSASPTPPMTILKMQRASLIWPRDPAGDRGWLESDEERVY